MNKFLLKKRSYLNVAFFYFLLACGIVYTISSPIIIEIGEKVGSSIADTGLIFSFYFAGFITGSMLSSFIIKHFDRKILILIFVAVLVFSNLLMYFAGSYFLLIIVFYLIGLSIGFIESQTSVAMIEINKKNEGLFVNLSQVFFGIGAFVGPLIPVFLMKFSIEWRLSYVIASLFCLIGLIYFSFIDLKTYLRDDLNAVYRKRNRNDSKNDNKSNGNNKNIKNNKTIETYINENTDNSNKKFATNKSVKSSENKFSESKFIFFCLVFAMFFYVFAETGFAAWLPTFLRTSKSFSESIAGQTLSYFWFASVFGRIIIGFLTKRIKITSILLVEIIITIFCCVAGIVLSQPILITISFIASGFFLSGIWPLIVTSGGLEYPAKKNFVVSMIILFGGIGGLVSPWLFSFILKKINFYVSFSLINLFLFLIFVFIFIIFLNETKLKKERFKSSFKKF